MSSHETACPGCGALRKTRNAEAHCHTCRKGGRQYPAGEILWMVQEGARLRERGTPPGTPG